MTAPRVAITGVGAVSCLGLDWPSIAGALREGRSGIVIDPERRANGFKSALTGRIHGYDVRQYVTKKQVKSMAEPAQFAVGAAVQAVQQARLAPEVLREWGTGLVVGNDSVALPAVEVVDQVRADKETRLLGSGRILQVMNSTVTMNLATFFGVRGASWTVSAACASGAHAIGQGYMLIKAGLQDVVLCGGAQEINWQSMASFDALGAFAAEGDDPGTCVRPFDRSRTGLAPSGGAAMLVLERLDRAVERGADILAEVVGYAFSSDGEHLTQPSGHGAVRVMRSVLEQGKRAAEEVEYINAHATGTPGGDVVEGRAIIEVFGHDHRKSPPVSSTKSMTGHECWMAGASEVVYSLIMMREGFLAPNINFTAADDGLERLDIVAQRRDVGPRIVLSNSFGFGGTNAALLLQAFEG